VLLLQLYAPRPAVPSTLAANSVLHQLALSVCSPWQWFCSARTLSNCLETTLTSIAIYYWPWQWPLTAIDNVPRSRDAKHVAHAEPGAVGSLTE
jgi:phosphatidylinositol glycan class B